MHWFAFQGASVYLPVGHSPHVDLIADFGDEIVRVQVKTSTFRRDARRWEVFALHPRREPELEWHGQAA